MDAFDDFIRNVSMFPKEIYVCVLCKNGGLFVFNREDQKFHSTDNSVIRTFDDPLMYNYEESLNKHIMCVMVFQSLDQMLEYISQHNYEKDIARYMLQMKSLSQEETY